jgi:hypothetical protein
LTAVITSNTKKINANRKRMPFVVGFSPRRSRFSPTAVHVEREMVSVAVGPDQVVLQVFRVSPANYHFTYATNFIPHLRLVQWTQLRLKYQRTQSVPTARIKKGGHRCVLHTRAHIHNAPIIWFMTRNISFFAAYDHCC